MSVDFTKGRKGNVVDKDYREILAATSYRFSDRQFSDQREPESNVENEHSRSGTQSEIARQAPGVSERTVSREHVRAGESRRTVEKKSVKKSQLLSAYVTGSVDFDSKNARESDGLDY